MKRCKPLFHPQSDVLLPDVSRGSLLVMSCGACDGFQRLPGRFYGLPWGSLMRRGNLQVAPTASCTCCVSGLKRRLFLDTFRDFRFVSVYLYYNGHCAVDVEFLFFVRLMRLSL